MIENFSNQDLSVHNQPCYDKEGNFLGWFTRSTAVVGLVFAKNLNQEWCVLASQRGKGTPDPEYWEHWNVCCGYLDFHETLEHAISREVFEEVGLSIPDGFWKLHSINSEPKGDKRQNVSHRYYTVLNQSVEDLTKEFTHKNNEKDEVGEIKFIPIIDISEYEWAFNHKQLITQIFAEISL